MSDTLLDRGELDWSPKLHLGCGAVYLDGYINIDVQGKVVTGPDEVPEDNKTTLDTYYRYDGDIENIPGPREVWVDKKCSMTNTGYANESIFKIVCIQALEHLSPYDARLALLHWWNILIPDGVLLFSVPDTAGTITLLDSEEVDVVKRLLTGSGKDDYASHLSWFTEEAIVSLLTELFFYDIEFIQENIHFYPALVIRCKKRDRFLTDRSYQNLPVLSPDCSVLDIGPGTLPFQPATHVLDIKPRLDLKKWGADCTVWDLDKADYLPWPINHFDFVYCSHVLEHLRYPEFIINEIQRVGKAGYIEVPSTMKDFLFQFGGVGHGRWHCLLGDQGELVFVARHARDIPVFEEGFNTIGRALFEIIHYDATKTQNEIAIRDFFWKHQDVLNIGLHFNAKDRIVPIVIQGGER